MVKLKCYYGNYDGKLQAMVAAPSKKRAAEVAGRTLYEFNQYWAQGGMNELAQANPEVLFVKSYYRDGEWERKE